MAVGTWWPIRTVAPWHLKIIQGRTPITLFVRRRSQYRRGRDWFWGWEIWILNPRPVPLTTFSSVALLINTVRKELSLSASVGKLEMWRGGKWCVTAWGDRKKNLPFVDSQGSSHGYTCFISHNKDSWGSISILCGSQELSLSLCLAGKRTGDVQHLAKISAVHSFMWRMNSGHVFKYSVKV